jgi:dihydroorotate dehydrogenase
MVGEILVYALFRSFLFRMDPESAHNLALWALSVAAGISPLRWLLQATYGAQPKPVAAFGLQFKNPVGLAAGYDKDARAVRALAALGFGHVEVGTVTPLAQPGNPKPRMFRLPEDEAIINRLGFPSRGSAYVQRRLNPGAGNWMAEMVGAFGRSQRSREARTLRRTAGCIVGVSLGKNKDTPNEQAVLDYLELLQNFARLADYLTINLSSPNTTGLRELQGRQALEALLTQLHLQRRMEQEAINRRLPLLVKLAPDLTESELDDALDVILRTHMDGVVVTDTTLLHEDLKSAASREPGGLSGSPLRQRSEAILRLVVQRVAGDLPVVSAGGIMGPDDAKRRLDMGATLLQVYTGLVYRGPGLVKKIVNSLPR